MIRFGHGKSQIRGAVFAGVLDDHIDDDVGISDRTENLRRQARADRGPAEA